MKKINEKEFEECTKTGVSIVDFYATWCGPCRMFGEILEEIEEEIGDKVNILKVDVDENEGLSRKFGVLSIPTILIMKDGALQEKHIGVWSKEDCIEAVKKYL